MNRITKWSVMLLMPLCAVNLNAQALKSDAVSKNDKIAIIRSEDELRFDVTLQKLLKGPSAATRVRAALAAGRIGDEKALPFLSEIIKKGSTEEASMAAFAIGEIESIKGAEHILAVLADTTKPDSVRAAAVEAAGKIAAANANSDKYSALGASIVKALEFEEGRGKKQNRRTVILAITAALRAKSENADLAVSKYLTNKDERIRADAANTLARLSSKNYGKELRSMLLTDNDAVARANAARALGAAEDKTAVKQLLRAAVSDYDLRVRVSAMSALGRINEVSTSGAMLEHAEKVFVRYKQSKDANPAEINELLTISTALGSIMKGTGDQRTVAFLDELGTALRNRAREVETALLRVSPKNYFGREFTQESNWRTKSAIAQAFGSVPDLEDSEEVKLLKTKALLELKTVLDAVDAEKQKPDLAFPDVLGAYAKFKQTDLADVLKSALKMDDVIIRSTAAGLIGELEPEKGSAALENYFALWGAYRKSETDLINDASLAALEGVKKQYLKLKDNKEIKVDMLEPVKRGLLSPDYMVRRKAREIAKDVGLETKSADDFVSFVEKGNARVKKYDYERAVSRKKASAVMTTAKGMFTVEFFPDAAPLTVENFINLAKSGYFNGLEIHRVVPNFVVQDGDPRGDGSGGPGWQIRCEINQMRYERGTVGMALSGKDTGGSQWFVAHSPQPHLDGGYTVFGKVNETGMKVVDKLTRGDVIEKVVIYEK